MKVLLYLLLTGSAFGLRADINHDGQVDLQDFAILAEEWLMSELGPELVINGAFSADSDWTKGTGWSISGGVADFLNTSGVPVQSSLVSSAALGITGGKTYRVTIGAVSGIGASTSYVVVLGGTSSEAITEAGAQSFDIIAGVADSLLKITATAHDGEGVFGLDNVSVKELSTADKIEKAIFDILRFNSTLSALVSSRIYPHVIPQNTSLPAIAYSQIAGPRQHDLTATSAMVPSRWQFTIVAETYAELRALSDALRGVLDNYSDTCGTVVIQCAHFTDETDLTDIVPGTDELRRYKKAIDFYIYYNE